MWSDLLIYAQEAEPPAGNGAAPSPGGGILSMAPLFLMMLAIMYLMIIRPGQKRERERRQMLDAVAKGDQVITTGGICGTVVGTSDKSVVLKVSDDPVTKIEFVRSAIAQVIREEVVQEPAKK